MDELSKVEPAVQDAKMGEFDEQPMMEKIEMSWNGGRILGWCLFLDFVFRWDCDLTYWLFSFVEYQIYLSRNLQVFFVVPVFFFHLILASFNANFITRFVGKMIQLWRKIKTQYGKIRQLNESFFPLQP